MRTDRLNLAQAIAKILKQEGLTAQLVYLFRLRTFNAHL